MKPYVFGVDIGGTSVKLGLFTTQGQLLDKWEIPTRTQNEGENVLPDVARSIRAKLDEKNISADQVEGVGNRNCNRGDLGCVPGNLRAHGDAPVQAPLVGG